MRHFYYNIYYKVRELDIRVSMPLFLGIFMLQQLKKQLKNTNTKIKNMKYNSLQTNYMNNPAQI